MAYQCYKCGHALDLAPLPISRQESCPKCHAHIHSCRMCQHYDVKSYNECKESSADRVVDKEKANFCDYYVPSTRAKASDSSEDLLAKANSLFKK